VANVLMKHKESTSRKFYIMNWANRELHPPQLTP